MSDAGSASRRDAGARAESPIAKLAWSIVLSLGAGGCKCTDQPSAPGTAAGAVLTASASSRPAAASAGDAGEPRGAPCRALNVTGRVLLGGAPLESGSELDGSEFISVEQGARVVVRHARTAREYAIAGPALALPCRRGREAVLLSSGSLQAAASAGARPGAGVTVATPLGVIHYAEASLTVRADGRKVEVRVTSGSADVEPAAGVRLEGRRTVTKGSTTLSGRPPATEELVDRCESAATKALESAAALLSKSPRDAGSLGERAAEQVHNRKAARSACAIAAAAAALEADPKKRAAQLGRIDEADRKRVELPEPDRR